MFNKRSRYLLLLICMISGIASSRAMTIEIIEDTDNSQVTVNISGTVHLGDFVNKNDDSFTQITPTASMTSGYGQLIIQGTKDADSKDSDQVILYELPTDDTTWTITDSNGNEIDQLSLGENPTFGTSTTATLATDVDDDSGKTFAMYLGDDSDYPGYLGFSPTVSSGHSIDTTNIYSDITLDDLGLTAGFTYTLDYGHTITIEAKLADVPSPTLNISITEIVDLNEVEVEISGKIHYGDLVNKDAIIFQDVTPSAAMTSGYGQIAIVGSKENSEFGSKMVDLYELPTTATWTVYDNNGETISSTNLSDLTASTLNFGTASTSTSSSTEDGNSKRTFAMWLNSESNHPGYLGMPFTASSKDSINTTNKYSNTTLDDLGLTAGYTYVLDYGNSRTIEITVESSDGTTTETINLDDDWVYPTLVTEKGIWLWSHRNSVWVFIQNFVGDEVDVGTAYVYVLDEADQDAGLWQKLKTTLEDDLSEYDIDIAGEWLYNLYEQGVIWWYSSDLGTWLTPEQQEQLENVYVYVVDDAGLGVEEWRTLITSDDE